MKPLTLAKVVLAIAGLAVFAFGVRPDNPGVRFVGIGLVAVAFLLRFVKDKPADGNTPE
jgi:hypothetical protein